MATAQAVRTSTKQEVTVSQSVALMKNIMRASIGEVCYIRNLFPGEVFQQATFANSIIRAMRPVDQDGSVLNDDAHRLLQWQEAAFEAIDRQYLRSMVLGIYTAEEDPAQRKLLESYVYNIKYPTSDEVEMTLEVDRDAFTLSRIRDESACMVRQLIRLCETMRPIPAERVLSLKLFYYDDVVPAGWQPRFFSDASTEMHAFFEAQPVRLSMGQVASKHHALSLKIAFLEDNTDLEEGGEGSSVRGATSAAPAAPTPQKVLPVKQPTTQEQPPAAAPAQRKAVDKQPAAPAPTPAPAAPSVAPAPAGDSYLSRLPRAVQQSVLAASAAADPEVCAAARFALLTLALRAGDRITFKQLLARLAELPPVPPSPHDTRALLHRAPSTGPRTASDAAAGRFGDLTSEQLRRIFRVLREAEDMLTEKASGFYVLTRRGEKLTIDFEAALDTADAKVNVTDTDKQERAPIAAAAAAASNPSKRRSTGTKAAPPITAAAAAAAAPADIASSTCSTPAGTPPPVSHQQVNPAPAAAASTADGSSPSSTVASQKRQSILLRANAIVAALETFAPAGHVTTDGLAAALSIHRDIARRLIDGLVEIRILSESSRGSRGREIIMTGGKAHTLLEKAKARAQELAEPGSYKAVLAAVQLSKPPAQPKAAGEPMAAGSKRGRDHAAEGESDPQAAKRPAATPSTAPAAASAAISAASIKAPPRGGTGAVPPGGSVAASALSGLSAKAHRTGAAAVTPAAVHANAKPKASTVAAASSSRATPRALVMQQQHALGPASASRLNMASFGFDAAW